MKDYLKMSDVFDCEVESDTDLMFSDSLGNIADFSGYKTHCRYAAHAINSHDELVESMNHYKGESERWGSRATKEASSLQEAMNRIAELEEFLYHFCDNSYNVDVGGGDYTATTCEAKDMAHKLDNRVWPDF